MTRTLQILAVGSDKALQPELEAALAGTRMRAVTRYAQDLRTAVELARAFDPDLVLAPMGSDPRTLRDFTEELAGAAPEAVVAALYKGDALEASGALVIGALRARVQDFLRRPLSTAELQQLLERLVLPARRAPAPTGKVVAFVSNKGGVGKSTLSVNVASALALKHPERVLLIDASVQHGHCAAMLDVTSGATLADAVAELERLDETFLRQLAALHPCGLRFLQAPTDPGEATSVTPEAISRLLAVARRAFDYIVVDTFPVLDGVVVSVLDVTSRAFVVFQGTVPTVKGIATFLDLLERVGVPSERQALVLNGVHPDYPGALRPQDVEEKLNRALDHVVPFDKKVLVATNTGQPRALSAIKLWGFGKAIQGIVAGLEKLQAEGEPARARAQKVAEDPDPAPSPAAAETPASSSKAGAPAHRNGASAPAAADDEPAWLVRDSKPAPESAPSEESAP